ncbi:hypothetical protein I6N90_01350 [Paenibacillus sp. GSMTC-2017]|uniref:DUF5680 domain-containing protein n=1 Tax=Paenibacillus sp. GSMTC-2017 TaxID=2794350 RepID=UPI0018D75D09|nr:DUF5680 domain-containing protein [Paenibacillus sp. GSMTC-2017]MBH5316450.1 hypothetical protein [Paenibacillus sp. GSMTC-2017]
MVDNELAIKTFIVEAKRAAYASGSGEKAKPTRPGAKDIPYKREHFAYLDSYYGEIHFSGQEVVWQNDVAKWSMNYFGYTHDPIEGFPEFLNACLTEVGIDAPFRGPAFKKSEKFEYVCNWEGDFHHFNGKEQILYQGKVIFSLHFHGGAIQYA